jgi:hypothetical protein
MIRTVDNALEHLIERGVRATDGVYWKPFKVARRKQQPALRAGC